MTIGAVSGGQLMKIGRRKAVLIACSFGIIGNVITNFLSFYNLIIGRLLFGFSVGLFSSMCPRFQEETYPSHLYDKLAPLYNFSQTVGTIFAYFFGEIIPDNDNEQALIDDENWRIIYFYFPVALYGCILVGYLVFLRNDAVKFLINDPK